MHLSINSITFENGMDDDIFRILVATDNHLGFMEKDAIRGDDSFASFEEIFVTARSKKVDCILFAGDMFHENKPSRQTIHNSITLFRKYCLGSDPVYTEIVSDGKEVFRSASGQVNFDDPNESICLPVYAIHGNHDDPSRECGRFEDSLSAMDILSAANLINYFGKVDRVDNIEINPLIINKNGNFIAIYALGAIRDERLNRMWNQNKVVFVRPARQQPEIKYFNIFVLHQNRDYGRGTKNCIHESMIPEWLDLVIWGNEHECIPHLHESLVGTYRIYQPGSSVATSLVDCESMSHPKSMGLIEIRKTREFRLKVVPFKNIRAFKYAEISLADERFGLDKHDTKIEEKLKKVLIQELNKLITQAREESGVAYIQNETSSVTNPTNPTSSTSLPRANNLHPNQFVIKSPEQVLVRLRVDHTGYPTINVPRLGSHFVNKIANLNDMVYFAKMKTRTVMDGRAVEGGRKLAQDIKQAFQDGAEEDIQRIKIEDLVATTLESNNKQLSLLPEVEMAQALDDFVMKRYIHAIEETVTAALKHIQQELVTDENTLNALSETASNHVNKAIINEATLKIKKKLQDETARSGGRAFEIKNRVRDEGVEKSSDVDEDDNEPAIVGNGNSRGRGKANSGQVNSKVPAQTGKRTGKKSPAAGKGRGRAIEAIGKDAGKNPAATRAKHGTDHSDDSDTFDDAMGAEANSDCDDLNIEGDNNVYSNTAKGKATVPTKSKAAASSVASKATKVPAAKSILDRRGIGQDRQDDFNVPEPVSIKRTNQRSATFKNPIYKEDSEEDEDEEETEPTSKNRSGSKSRSAKNTHAAVGDDYDEGDNSSEIDKDDDDRQETISKPKSKFMPPASSANAKRKSPAKTSLSTKLKSSATSQMSKKRKAPTTASSETKTKPDVIEIDDEGEGDDEYHYLNASSKQTISKSKYRFNHDDDRDLVSTSTSFKSASLGTIPLPAYLQRQTKPTAHYSARSQDKTEPSDKMRALLSGWD